MTHALALVGVALLTVSTALCAGLALLHALRLRLHRGETFFLAFLSGSASLSLAVYLLTAAHLAYKPVFLAVAVLALLLGWRPLCHALTLPAQAPLPRPLALLFLFVYIVYFALYLPHALLPETMADALSYHVAFPARYLQAHSFTPHTATLYAGMPQGIEMLFLFAYAFGGSSAPALVHLTFLATLPFGMLCYARRRGLPLAGVLGALFFFLSPICGRTGTTAYVDVALAAVAFGLFYALELWRELQDDRLLPIAGLLAGFAFSVKYSAGLALPYALAVVLFTLYRQRRPLLRPALLVLSTALLLPAPALLRNAVTSGNPLLPVANRLFPNPVIQPWFEDVIAAGMRRPNSVDPREIPIEATLRGARLTGATGPLFLLAPLALLALRRREGRQLLLAAAVFGASYFASTSTRFLIPVLPFVSLALAIVLARPAPLGLAVLLAHSVLSYPNVLDFYLTPGAWRLGPAPWADALGHRPEAAIVQDAVPASAMAPIVNATVPPQARILCLGGFPQLRFSPELLFPGRSSQAHSYRAILLSSALADFRPSERFTLSFAARRARALRLSVTLPPGEFPFSLSELRILHIATELPRSTNWRLRTSSNIWEAPRALDANPATTWTAADNRGRPQSFELHFDMPLQFDALQLDGPPPPTATQIELALLDESGAWQPVQATIARTPLEPPARLRRAAIEALKREGIAWLLVDNREPGAPDLAARPLQYGITAVAARGDFTLYRFD